MLRLRPICLVLAWTWAKGETNSLVHLMKIVQRKMEDFCWKDKYFPLVPTIVKWIAASHLIQKWFRQQKRYYRSKEDWESRVGGLGSQCGATGAPTIYTKCFNKDNPALPPEDLPVSSFIHCRTKQAHGSVMGIPNNLPIPVRDFENIFMISCHLESW